MKLNHKLTITSCIVALETESLELRSQLAEALANEQSSAKAYAESQAREALALNELKAMRKALLGGTPVGGVFWRENALTHLDEFLVSNAPAPDLVGVIKSLSAAVEWMRDECGYASPVWIRMNDVLESTREIRERVGAT